MRLLQRNARVRRATAAASCRHRRRGGGRRDGRPVDWFFYVNGVEGGERRGLDHRGGGRPHLVGPPRLGRRERVPAVVGSFPEPFVNGIDAASATRSGSSAPTPGRRVPARAVQRRLTDEDVPAAVGRLGGHRT